MWLIRDFQESDAMALASIVNAMVFDADTCMSGHRLVSVEALTILLRRSDRTRVIMLDDMVVGAVGWRTRAGQRAIEVFYVNRTTGKELEIADRLLQNVLVDCVGSGIIVLKWSSPIDATMVQDITARYTSVASEHVVFAGKEGIGYTAPIAGLLTEIDAVYPRT